jgi:hypothetical protein
VLLRELGCSMAQGLFIARPMAAADFLLWSKAHLLAPPGDFVSHRGRDEIKRN